VVTQAEAAVDKSIQVTSTTSGDIPIWVYISVADLSQLRVNDS
jgi:hypothetical protein